MQVLLGLPKALPVDHQSGLKQTLRLKNTAKHATCKQPTRSAVSNYNPKCVHFKDQHSNLKPQDK